MGRSSADPYAATELRPLRDGQLLAGRYRLVRLIGEGGMGSVWEARQITTDKAVAIKVLKGRDADTSRFLREARIVARLTHRNIVQVFDLWEPEGDGPVFMVMELLAGETLGARLDREGRLPLAEALWVALAVGSGLRAAHACGVVHRDLKPDNVLLATGGPGEPVEVKILDFGIAKPTAPEAQATAITETGTVMGTVHYMSPEQVYGQKDIDARSDVWALGVVLYECVAGEKPFLGENFGQIFRAITRDELRPLRQVAPGAPAWLDALLTRMLARDREARPRIDEVLAAIAAQAHGAARIEPAPPFATTVHHAPSTSRPPRPDPIAAGAPSTGEGLAASRPAYSFVRSPRARRAAIAMVVASLAVGGAAIAVAARMSPGLKQASTSLLSATASAPTLASSPSSPAPSAPPPPSPSPSPTPTPTPPASASASPPPPVRPPPPSRPRPTASPLDRGRF